MNPQTRSQAQPHVTRLANPGLGHSPGRHRCQGHRAGARPDLVGRTTPASSAVTSREPWASGRHRSPAGFENYFRKLADLLAVGPPALADNMALAGRYGLQASQPGCPAHERRATGEHRPRTVNKPPGSQRPRQPSTGAPGAWQARRSRPVRRRERFRPGLSAPESCGGTQQCGPRSSGGSAPRRQPRPGWWRSVVGSVAVH
jgi:hypothetical protein